LLFALNQHNPLRSTRASSAAMSPILRRIEGRVGDIGVPVRRILPAAGQPSAPSWIGGRPVRAGSGRSRGDTVARRPPPRARRPVR
jgi:hypothetical protein